MSPTTNDTAAPRRATDLVITGHRGAMGVEPENTLRSFRRAVAEGCAEVELDLRLSADGHLVLLHDDRLTRTHGVDSSVSELTLDELRALDPDPETRIPTFAEVVEAIDIGIQAEIKDPRVCAQLTAMLDADPDLARRTRVTSFNDAALGEVIRLRPGTPIGLITDRVAAVADTLVERAREVTAATVMCDLATLLPEHMADFRAAGLAVTAWPVQDMAELRRAVDLGVDGITTDNPHLLDPAALAG
ncbi:glycerophosphoryl diester phosphodiesterase [Murinocardiopsis flavida]|uniref:Glycerophosphoryl diester phosphodiesterase n=1 Tax=Murinocardiopsis flavida TaxID=645275 RepID=A0A2P8DQ19_9ACTN|nr:glycerophosphodiester phosphodiesterase [Murinocardiopsis flavida]PSK99310.1 glycerophosphoryl diester phosphodiesterase [Murinocardiopsis flavida]